MSKMIEGEAVELRMTGTLPVALPRGAVLSSEQAAMLTVAPTIAALGLTIAAERLTGRVMREHGVTPEAWGEALEGWAKASAKARGDARRTQRALERKRVEVLNAPLKPAEYPMNALAKRRAAEGKRKVGELGAAYRLLDEAVEIEEEAGRARWAGFALSETASLAAARGEDVDVSREQATAGRLNVRTRDGLKLLADSGRIGARAYQAGQNFRQAWETAGRSGAGATASSERSGGRGCGDPMVALRQRAAAGRMIEAAEALARASGGDAAVTLLRLVAGEGASLRVEEPSRRPRERMIKALAEALDACAPALGA